MGGDERRDASARAELKLKIFGPYSWIQRRTTLVQLGSGYGCLLKEFGEKSLSVEWGRG